MAYRDEEKAIVIDGWENGISPSPYQGIGNIRNLNTNYYPDVAYVNYRRQLATLASTNEWYAGTHSVDVSGNLGWVFTAPISAPVMTNPVQYAQSPAGLDYILDDSGQIWKQTAVNSSSFNLIEAGLGRVGDGAGGIAYWNNYLVVIGDGLIEFCGDGTDDSGVTSSNWNIQSSSSSVQVTSTILDASLLDVGYAWTGTVLSGATSATLTNSWNGTSGAYFVRFSNAGTDTRTVTFTNGSGSVSWSGGLGSDAGTGFFVYQFTATDNTFVGYSPLNQDQQVTFSSTGTLPTGIVAATPYYLLETVDLTGATVFQVSANQGGEFIPLTDAGSGLITMSLVPSLSPPVTDTTITGFTWGTSGLGSTTLTLSSPWLYASGIYNIVDPNNNQFIARFTYDSTLVVLNNPAAFQADPSGTFSVQILSTTTSITQAPYKAYISKNDGNLYFCNGRNVGSIQKLNSANVVFNPGIPSSYNVSYSTVALQQPSDTAVDLTDLQDKLIIAGNKDLYAWNYTSSNPASPVPVGEQIYSITNLLNNIYVLSGQKGNIYVSNGYSAQVFYKIPDFVAGVIDPIWSWGGNMVHRSKLFFQALAQNTSGTNILSGTFSLIVSPTILGESGSGLVMESQNSYGLTPASGSLSNGLLINDSPSGSGQDAYYSAWSNGANVGGIDFNDTSLWQNNEPVIETDIIPIGTILNKQTFGNIEFKLDRPLATGDSITMYWRPSLTDNYILMGTSTTTQLSEYFTSNISQSQWAQFKITFDCAASGSSFIPLREIRLHYS